MQMAKSLTFGLLLVASLAQAADEIPTADELKQLQTEKKWQELLQGSTRAIALKGDKAAGYDRIELLNFKAEAQLQLKQFPASAATFESVSKEKLATPDQIDQALAMSAILKKTDAKGYKAPATKTEASRLIDITIPDNRKDAFIAASDAAIADVRKEFEKASRSPALPALAKVAKQARDGRFLERAATGNDQTSKSLVKDIDAVASKSIRRWLDDTRRDLDAIRVKAEETVEIRDAKTGFIHRQKRGVDGAERDRVNAIISQCRSSAASYKQFADAVDEPSSELKSLPGEIDRLFKEATNLTDVVVN